MLERSFMTWNLVPQISQTRYNESIVLALATLRLFSEFD